MIETTKSTNKKIKISWRAFLIGPILTIHMFSYVGPVLFVQQYVYYSVQKEKLPETNYTTQVHFTCETNTTSDKYKLQVRIQQETSKWLLYLSIASGVPAIFVNFLLGCYSDRFGRKMMLLFSLVGLFIKTSLSALAVYLEWDIYCFILIYAIDGLCGAQMGPMTIAFSVAADLTSPDKNRSFGIALIDVALGSGIVLGNFTSGYLIKAFGFAYPLTLTAGLYIVDILLVIILLPETRRIQDKPKHVPLIQNVKDACSFYVDSKLAKEGKRWIYITCTLIFLMDLVSNIGKQQIDTLYEINAPFCWQSVQIGIFGMVRSIVTFIIGIPSIKLFQRCLSDDRIALIGLISNTLSLIQEGVAPNSIVLYLVSVVGFGSMIAIPMTRGIMSKITPPEKQGALFSGSGSVSALCSVLGSVFGNGIYTGTVGIYRGLVYLLMAVPGVIGICMTVFLIIRMKPFTKDFEKNYTIQIESGNIDRKPTENGTGENDTHM